MNGGPAERGPVPSYGRRRGRKLRGGRQALLDTLLPAISVAPPVPGAMLDLAGQFAERPQEVWLEVGFGAGEHLAWQAERHPLAGIVGCEPYVNGIGSLLARIAERGLRNVRVWPGDVRALLPAVTDGTIARAFALFPDPWPKARHHKRRLVARPFLDELARVLRPGAELRLATDDAPYLESMIERLISHPSFEWLARSPADWWERPEDWPATRYEQKAVASGRRPAFLRFRRR